MIEDRQHLFREALAKACGMKPKERAVKEPKHLCSPWLGRLQADSGFTDYAFQADHIGSKYATSQ
jgi:hypothetical protein